MEKIILKIDKLKKSFGEIKAVNDISLSVEKGDIYGFLGPNGAGKSTTIRMILGLVNPDEGTIIINGRNIQKNYKEALSKVGAMVETPSFHEYLTGYENLKLQANLFDNIKDNDIKRVLNIVGLTDRAENQVGTYSVGMKQRLGLARALLNNPEIIILDEPTSGLDPQGKKEIRELIKVLANNNDITFFICTHQLNEVEQICNRVVILQEGKVVSNKYLNKESTKKWVHFYTKQKTEAQMILKDYDKVDEIKISKFGILLYLKEKEIESINYLFNRSNIKIKYIIPENESLEDYYLKETGGNFNVV